MSNSQTDSQSTFPLTLAEVLFEELTQSQDINENDARLAGVKAQLNVITGLSSEAQVTDIYKQYPQIKIDTECDTSEKKIWDCRKKFSKLVVVPALYKIIRELPRKGSALCLSGGGVRSAVFNLGILQGLARCGLLDKFDYLSTVSGGGFIGSWLSAWTRAEGGNIGEVARQLADPPHNPLDPEPGPLYNLRIYANYLTPKKGLLSVDTWTLIAVYLRNLLLNWMVFIPVIMALLMLPRIWVAIVTSQNFRSPLGMNILLGIGFAGAVVALSYISTNLPSAKLWNWSRNRFVALCLVPLVISAMGLTSYWFRLDREPKARQFIVVAELLCIVPAVFCLIVRLAKWQWAGVLGLYTLGTSVFAFLIAGLLIWYITYILKVIERFSGAYYAQVYASLAVPLLLALLTVGGTFIAGFTSRKTDSDDQEWWARSGAWILIVVVSWSVFHLLVLFGPVLLVGLEGKLEHLLFTKGWDWEDIKSVGAVLVGIVSGAITLFGGSSTKTPAQGEQGKPPDWKAKVLSIGTSVAAVVFGAFIVIVLALITNWILASGLVPGSVSQDANNTLHVVSESSGWLLVVFALLIFLVGWGLGLFINTNRFSLHFYWRNRMMRAYLGATKDQDVRDTTKNKFTDFDMTDNVFMHDLKQKPMHVVNVTLNLAGGEKLQWQDRKAESFSISPWHCGSFWLGYRKSDEYTKKGITLATSVAISGAAASPNMGYMMTSPVVRFIMTLFNVRMGFWLGNPGVAGRRTFGNDSPTQSVQPIVAEALGLTDDKSAYVYLSDGGHFDNFGLYEMILRRCRFIVVSDASTDTTYCYESLASSIRQIRVDFGVPIELRQPEKVNCHCEHHRHHANKLERMHFGNDPDKPNKYCAIFDIRYSCVDKPGSTDPDPSYDGVLIYIKPSLDGSEPADVLNYRKADEAFPEDTIADQWFSESQFESYRMLGSHMVTTICPHKVGKEADHDPLGNFVTQAEAYVRRE